MLETPTKADVCLNKRKQLSSLEARSGFLVQQGSNLKPGITRWLPTSHSPLT